MWFHILYLQPITISVAANNYNVACSHLSLMYSVVATFQSHCFHNDIEQLIVNYNFFFSQIDENNPLIDYENNIFRMLS